jgi:2-amino-4-hydroxy-6-hydroxymethyldihydropteridine diphosphokinase
MIVIGLGANLPGSHGAPVQTLLAVIDDLEQQGIKVKARAKFYETAPVPASDQPWYVNTVVAVETDLEPEELLDLLLKTEDKFGRERSVANASRVIDLDLIAYDDEIRTKDPLLPHPRLQERAFVLYPLRDIAPDWIHPLTKQNIKTLMERLPPGQQIRLMQEAA